MHHPAQTAAKTLLLLAAALLLARPAVAQFDAPDIDTSALLHAIPGADPAAQNVPGESFPFLQLPPAGSDAPAIVHLITPTDFAGPLDEQVYVRWWDGHSAHWVMGCWVKNVQGAAVSPLLPPDERLDLWRVEIPASARQDGPQYYAIQVKGVDGSRSVERYLLARPGGDFTRTNALGQIWSSSEEFEGQDWPVAP